MAEMDRLPPDQRAAVQLLLQQGRSYGELSELLGIEEISVRRRAHIALETLAPESGRLSAGDRGQLSDYLLGQQSVREREDTRDLLSSSAPARAWARAVAGVLRPLAPDALPDIPESGPAAERADAVGRSAPTERAAPIEHPEPRQAFAAGERVRERVRDRADRLRARTQARRARGERRETADELAPFTSAPGQARPGSRLGGALLLGGVAIIIAVVVILLIGGGDEGEDPTPTRATAPPTQTAPPGQTGTTAAPGGQPAPEAQIPLRPSGGGRGEGLAQVYRRDQQRLVLIVARGVPQGAYAAWLYNSASDAELLGFLAPRQEVQGYAGQGPLPAEASRFGQLVITRENVRERQTPTRPGEIVLSGQLQPPPP